MFSCIVLLDTTIYNTKYAVSMVFTFDLLGTNTRRFLDCDIPRGD